MSRDLSLVEWIFFDLGSTLLDETKCLMARFTRAAALAADFGVDVAPRDLWHWGEQAYSAFSPSPFRAALARTPLTKDQQNAVYHSSPYVSAGEELYAGVESLLIRLSDTYGLGIIANQVPGLPKRLERHGMDGHFRLQGRSRRSEDEREKQVQDSARAPAGDFRSAPGESGHCRGNGTSARTWVVTRQLPPQSSLAFVGHASSLCVSCSSP